jgi:pimeloyl-ACP methyl ester carboxylesterase
MARTLAVLVLVALGSYAALLAFLWWRQESLLFYPEPLPAGYPLAREPDVRELTVEVPGARLSVLQLKLAQPKGVVFFLHGNAGNLANWFGDTQLYRRANYDLVMMDYRGYGKSTGRVTSERQLREDARAVWQAVAAQYRGKKLVVLGQSLGSALAADLSADLTQAGAPPDLTVLVSAYSSMRELASDLYPWVPSMLLRYPLDTASHASQLRHPVLLIHGERDELIAIAHAQRLNTQLRNARLEVIGGAGHNDMDFDHVLLDTLAAL